MPVSSPEEPSLSQRGFDRAIEGYRHALDVYMKGDPRPVMEFFSRREDVTIANPILPARRGPEQVDEAVAAGAAQLRDGFTRGFEEVARYSTPTLATWCRSNGRRPGSRATTTSVRSPCG